MIKAHGLRLAAAAVVLLLTGSAESARAGDFLSGLFGAFGARPAAVSVPSTPLSYGSPEDEVRSMLPALPTLPARPAISTRLAYCVRSCDGRYFPVPATEGESAATVCNSFCPASPTKVVYSSPGGSIDNAVTASGQSYSDLPNAFRYRSEMVSGCSCNGKSALGLAAIKIDEDRTLRKGDIVSGAGGLVVATARPDKRRTASFTPAPSSIREKYERMPVLASE